MNLSLEKNAFRTLVIASTNKGKVQEFKRLLSNYPLEVIAQPGGLEVEETGKSFIDNARLKAIAAARYTGDIALADDSGLCVKALGGAPGVTGGTVVILGGGVVGENAAVIATGMQAKVHIVDKSEARLKQLVEMFGDKIIPEQSDKIDLNKLVSEADLLVGGVLIPGAEAPKLVTKEMIKLMKRGSVIVDVAIDQGGCVETSKPTTHGDPTYIVDDVVHYCVANMPGGVPRTSTLALNNATLPFLVKLANQGYQKALGEDKNFLAGLNVHKGHVTYRAVADVFGHSYVSPEEAIKN